MADYLKHAERKNVVINSDSIECVMKGVRDLFDYYVESHLLYRLEKVQYARVMETTTAKEGDEDVEEDPEEEAKEQKSACDVYGSAHLLRFMVKVNELLNAAWMGDEVSAIEAVLADFLDFLEVNLSKYFTSKNYVEADEESLKALE